MADARESTNFTDAARKLDEAEAEIGRLKLESAIWSRASVEDLTALVGE